MAHVLIALTGTYSGPRDRLGDYGDWFRDLCAEAGVDTAVWRAREEPAPGAAPGGIVITGSSASVTRPEPWIDRLAEWARGAGDRGVPILGVCFGHQLLAAAFGGAVEKHPGGREVGTVAMELTPQGRGDPLFDGVPDRFVANATHADHVCALPPGAVVLARNDWVPVQAFALGPRVRGVQFHPEYSGEALRAYAAANRTFLDEEAGPGAADRVVSSARDAPQARAVVANFVRYYVNELC